MGKTDFMGEAPFPQNVIHVVPKNIWENLMKNTNKIDSNKITRPRKGDRLFMSGDDWWHNACLNFLPDKWDLYATGYKLAGDLLVEHTKNTRSDQDPLVYPIVFLYRQYLELRLKELIKIGSQFLNISRKIPTHHRIDDIWIECKKILEKIPPTSPKNDLDAVEECINQFSEKDPSSIAFRYPTDKNDNPSTPSLTHINLRNLSEVIDRVSSLLDGASIGISEYANIKHEMEAEFRNCH